jgi:hypothetical protein
MKKTALIGGQNIWELDQQCLLITIGHMGTEVNYNFDVDKRGKISKIRCPPGRYGKDIWLSPQQHCRWRSCVETTPRP